MPSYLFWTLLANRWAEDVDFGSPMSSWTDSMLEQRIRENPAKGGEVMSEDNFFEGGIVCWICDGEMQSLGALGNVVHYRCQNCGSEAHRLEHWNDYYWQGSEGAAECQDVTPEIVTTPEDPS